MSGKISAVVNQKKSSEHHHHKEEEETHSFYPVIRWLMKYRQHLFYGAMIALSALFALSRYSTAAKSQAESDYATVEQQFALISAGRESEETLVKTEDLIKGHPELRAKYDYFLAHHFIKQNNAEKAAPWIDSCFSRQSNESPYHRYALTTALIEQNQLKPALEQAQVLQNEIEREDRASTAMLHAMNLVRIAFLTQEVGTAEQASLAWGAALPAVKQNREIEQHFVAGSITLADYAAALSEQKNQ